MWEGISTHLEINFFSEIKILHGDISVPVYHVWLQKICPMGSEGYLGLPGGVGKGGNSRRHILGNFTM